MTTLTRDYFWTRRCAASLLDSGTDSARGRGPEAMSRGNATDQRVLGQGNSRQVWALIFYTMILSSTYLIEKV